MEQGEPIVTEVPAEVPIVAEPAPPPVLSAAPVEEVDKPAEEPAAPAEQQPAPAPAPAVTAVPPKPRSLMSRPPPLPPPLPTQKNTVSPPTRPTTRSSTNPKPKDDAATSKYNEDSGAEEPDEDDDHGSNKGGNKGTKSRWTADEDKELLRIIQESPTLSWEDIASKMPGRKASGCAMRWYNFVRKTVDPAILLQAASTAPPPLAKKPKSTKPKPVVPRNPEGEDELGEDDALGESDSEYNDEDAAGEEDDWIVGDGDGTGAKSRSLLHKKPRHPAVSALAGTPQGRTIYSPRASDASNSSPGSASGTNTDSGSPGKLPVIRGRRTHKPDELEGTLFSPNGKKQKVHTCPEETCKAAFKRSEHLKRHYRSVHMMQKPYPCEQENCPKMFSRKDNLQQHMKMVHNVQTPPSPSDIGAFPAVLADSGAANAATTSGAVPSVLAPGDQPAAAVPAAPSPTRSASSGWAAPPPPGASNPLSPTKSNKRGRVSVPETEAPQEASTVAPAAEVPQGAGQVDPSLEDNHDTKRARLDPVVVAQQAMEFKTGLAPQQPVASTSAAFNTGAPIVVPVAAAPAPAPFNTGVGAVTENGDLRVDAVNEVDQIFAAGPAGIEALFAGLGELPENF